MRKAILLAFLGIACVRLTEGTVGAEVEPPLQITAVNFLYPLPEARQYHLAMAVVANEGVKVTAVEVNGEKAKIIDLLGEDGQPQLLRLSPGGKGVLRAAVAWRGDADYRVKVTATQEGGKVTEASWEGKAPKGGYWDPAWAYYKAVVVQEDWGMERVQEPVEVSIGFPAGEIADPEAEIRVVEVSPAGEHREIPSQVYDVRRSEIESGFSPASLSCTIAFLADVPARGKKTYLIFHGNKAAAKPEYATDLVVTGEGLGLTVENDWYRMELSPKHGQFLALSPKGVPGTRWTFQQGSIHWNPDVFPQGRPWTHTVEWNPPPGITEERGPILVRTKRFGPLPGAPEVDASVTYKFFAHQPWIMVNSLLEFQQDLPVQAVRTGEIVFDVGTFSMGAWRGRDGQVGTVEMLGRMPSEEAQLKGKRALLEGGVPWVCMFNPGDRLGVGGVNIANFSGSFGEGEVAGDQSDIYFCNPGYAFIYWNRSTVYPYLSPISSASVVVPKGYILAERTAYTPFRMGETEETRFSELDALHYQLTHPLRVIQVGWPPATG